ncbi:hypothetical protein CABS01_08371 [Colletotrichum abscissum]|uniref:Uncharacterized protein n=1 Tax=Colletotrichum abscissum TaxID=1671311 RepID=A0A9Q0B3G3_9PEZI|nr:uncharacterized protein CABS01_08371 [Colletotrichum abscissum]KAI3549209.1 hypothetical protein CABS02_08037 [Colletotrichum abscissum]KAK1507191.1 hypothetical protein CABS01_08371 [Colletotrichum abscissum]
MGDQQAKPPIVAAIRNDAPLPDISIGDCPKSKNLRDAGETANKIDLPRVLSRAPSDYYTKVADRFLDTADFRLLDGVDLGPPNPTILFHRNVSDVARSIEDSINRDVGLVLVKGHMPGTLVIDRTTQAGKMIKIHNHQPFEPASIIPVPGWTAKCKLTAPGQEPIESMLVAEHKDRGLVVVEEFEKELDKAPVGLLNLWQEVQNNAAELTEMLETANNEGIAQDFLRLTSGLRNYTTPHNREFESTFGIENHPKSPFEKEVTTTLHGIATHAVVEDAPYAILGDYQSLAIFEFTDMLTFPKVNEIDRLRRGPGNRVRVLVLNNEPQKIRRNMIGVWLKSIGSESGEAWMKSTGSD